MEMGGAVWWKLLKSNVPTDWCGYHQCGSEQSISSPWWNLICAKCNSAPMASLKKCQRGGDKDILRAGKGNLSDKCGHLPPSNHPQTAVLAQQTFSEKIVFLLAGKASLPPLFTLAAGAVRSSRNRFFGDFVRQKRGLRASQRFPCQPVMTLLDNIGHLVRRCSIVSDWSHFSHDLLHWSKFQEFKKLDPAAL